jgi:NADPH-dependent dioxygenase
VAVTAAVQYGEWLSVRTVGGTDADGPAPLPDPDARLRTALGLARGCWVLVRPDGYVAARGNQMTRSVLDRAFAPLRLAAPLAGEAVREPGPGLRAPVPRPKEY